MTPRREKPGGRIEIVTAGLPKVRPILPLDVEAALLVAKALFGRDAKPVLACFVKELQKSPGDPGDSMRKAGQILMRFAEGTPGPAGIGLIGGVQQSIAVPDGQLQARIAAEMKEYRNRAGAPAYHVQKRRQRHGTPSDSEAFLEEAQPHGSERDAGRARVEPGSFHALPPR